MICYAIKNEKGMYLQVGDYAPFWDFFQTINYATLFTDFELVKKYCFSDCQVVKVEIREVEENV